MGLGRKHMGSPFISLPPYPTKHTKKKKFPSHFFSKVFHPPYFISKQTHPKAVSAKAAIRGGFGD